MNNLLGHTPSNHIPSKSHKTNNGKLQIGRERASPSQFVSHESNTPWPMRDVKDNAIYRKSSK